MGLLDIILILLLLFWIGGFSFHLLGSFIHLFLVLALIVLILRILGVKI